jgi:hypothetical protein
LIDPFVVYAEIDAVGKIPAKLSFHVAIGLFGYLAIGQIGKRTGDAVKREVLCLRLVKVILVEAQIEAFSLKRRKGLPADEQTPDARGVRNPSVAAVWDRTELHIFPEWYLKKRIPLRVCRHKKR